MASDVKANHDYEKNESFVAYGVPVYDGYDRVDWLCFALMARAQWVAIILLFHKRDRCHVYYTHARAG